MLRALLFPFLMLGCAHDADWPLAERPADHQPPPGPNQLTLDGPAVVVAGTTYTWTVRGPDLPPGTTVDLGWGGADTGGPCPYPVRVGGWLCLDIVSPAQRLQTTTAVQDPTTGGGMASFTLTAPVTTRAQVFLQGLSVDGLQSATTGTRPVSIVNPPACPGNSATLTTQADVIAHQGCTTLFNLLVQNGSDITDLHLPLLQDVANDIWVSNQAALQSISLPALTEAGAVRVRDNPLLTDVDLSVLAETTGTFSVSSQSGKGLEFQRNDALTSLYLPALTDVVGQLYLLDNAALQTADFPAFTATTDFSGSDHGFAVLSHDSLTRATAPALETVGDLFVQNNLTLTDVDVSSLQASQQSVSWRNNAALISATLPALTSVGDFVLMDNHAQLTTLTLPALETIATDVFIRDNTLLDAVDLTALTSIGGNLNWERNPAWCVPSSPAPSSLASGTVTVSNNLCNP